MRDPTAQQGTENLSQVDPLHRLRYNFSSVFSYDDVIHENDDVIRVTIRGILKILSRHQETAPLSLSGNSKVPIEGRSS